MWNESRSAVSRVRQLPSHNHLLKGAGAFLPSGCRPLDAVIIPTARPAAGLFHAFELVRHTGVTAVILCSKDSSVTDVIEMADKYRSVPTLAVEVPPFYEHAYIPKRSSRARIGDRDSDLSVKRNIGVLFARLIGWSKIMFLDDDVTIHRGDLRVLAAQLDMSPAAGFNCNEFPDNSVVCHANRHVGNRQEIFVSGGALGLNCADHPLPFFPDIYNEDWFSFFDMAADRLLQWVGSADQEVYDPFNDALRARHQEFGDFVAEGLYGLLSTGTDLHTATDSRYWDLFQEARLALIQRIAMNLNHPDDSRILLSLKEAEAVLASVSPEDCVDFIDDWNADRRAFSAQMSGLPHQLRYSQAWAELHLANWQEHGTNTKPSPPNFRFRRRSLRPAASPFDLADSGAVGFRQCVRS